MKNKNIQSEQKFELTKEESNTNPITFQIAVFFEFFIYHFLHHFILGPLIIPFISLFRGRYIISNLSFFKLDLKCLYQTMFFLSTFPIIFIYFYYRPSYLYFIEIFMIFSAGLLRISIVSIKYATMTPEKLQQCFKKYLSVKEKKSELTLDHWFKQDESTINEELLRLLKKDLEDLSFFKMNFIGEINGDLEEQLKKSFESLDLSNSIFNKYDGSLLSNLLSSKLKYYCGLTITKFILTKTRSDGINYRWCISMTFFISLFRSLIPILYRHYDNNNIDLDLKYYDILLIVLVTILNNFNFAKNFEFIIFGIHEFDKQYRYLSQISNLLSTKKQDKHHVKKFYPTINLFDTVSLKSWNKIHKIFRQYGEKFKLRISAYLSLFVIFYILVISYMATGFFLNQAIISQSSFLVLMYEVLCIIFAILIIFKKGCAINEHYSIHIVLLRKNREILFDLMKFGEIYFDQSKFISENPVYVKGVENIKRIIDDRIQDNLKLKGYLMKDNYKFKVRKEVLKLLINTTDDVIHQLIFEAENNPFSIFGIPLTDNVFRSILAIFGSILLAILKKNI